MDSSCLASITVNKLRRVRIFSFLVESLTPKMPHRCKDFKFNDKTLTVRDGSVSYFT